MIGSCSSRYATVVREYMAKQFAKKDKDPLLQTRNGTMYSIRNIRKISKEVGADIGCPWVTPHTMRHTFASRLFENGTDIKRISNLLGHAKVSTTYDIYVHIMNKQKTAKAIQKLDSVSPSTLPIKIAPNKTDKRVKEHAKKEKPSRHIMKRSMNLKIRTHYDGKCRRI